VAGARHRNFCFSRVISLFFNGVSIFDAFGIPNADVGAGLYTAWGTRAKATLTVGFPFAMLFFKDRACNL
jgi:hypothetical protein